MNNQIVLFHKTKFILQFGKYFIIFVYNRKFTQLYTLLLYFIIFMESEIKCFIKPLKLPYLNSSRKIILLNNSNKDTIINLLYFLLTYFKKPYILNNFNNFNYIITSILFQLLTKSDLLYILDETWIKWISLGSWTFFISLFARNKYKEWSYKYNFSFSNFFKNKNKYNDSYMRFWKIYYKYGGNYNQYLYLKNFFLLNKHLNQKLLVVYDFNLNQFVLKLNNYYSFLMLNFQNDYNITKKDYTYMLFNIFLKQDIDTPFLNNEIPFTFYYFYNKIDKKKLKKLSYLISYDYLYSRKKKGVLSNLTEAELWENYKNFYKWTINENFENDIKDVFNIEGSQPYITPPRPYKKLQNSLDYETIFKDIQNFQIDDLQNIILKSFEYINQSDMMLSINSDLWNDLVQYRNINNINELPSDINIFDYKNVKNDLNLCVWLNKNALNDKSFNNFLLDLKYLSSNVTKNVLNIDLFEEMPLSDNSLLDLFLRNNFFYLDYFTIAMNSKKYSLCYLVFVFKILKNIKNYELYYSNFCKKKIKKYNKIVYDYHSYNFSKLHDLSKTLKFFIKYKTNNILLNINNFDTYNFIKKLKNNKFDNLYKKNYKNTINYKDDYNQFLIHFERFKTYTNFEKKNINMSNITFDDFVYNDINIDSLLYSIYNKQQKLKKLMSYYIYENNKLSNFLDLGFYLYEIEGFEHYQQDIFLFYEYKEHKYLQFLVDDNYIFPKIEFQKNYTILYFHYIIKLFKNLKQYTFNTAIENILFQDDTFIYSNFETSMHEKRVDFLEHLEFFLKAFKTTLYLKVGFTANFVNYLILSYAKLIEYNEILDYKNLYNSDILEKNNDEDLYKLEINIDRIMQIWKHILEKIEDSRKFYAESINVLKLEKLIEFFDFPMFNKVKGFLLLKEAYLISLEEMVIEERAFDHTFNITMCLFRIFDKHNTFFRQQVLYKNGKMSRLSYLEIEDWSFIFDIEKTNPFILIELYNSKQRVTKSPLWNNSIKIIDIIYNLSNIHEKESAYNTLEEDWTIFFNNLSKRDLIIYDLTVNDIAKLKLFFEDYNNTSYNQIDIEESIAVFLNNNNLQYNHKTGFFNKVQKQDDTDIKMDIKEKKDYINVNTEIQKIGLNSKVNVFFNNKMKYIKESDLEVLFDFNIFSTILDAQNKNIEIEDNKYFLKFLLNKIKNFKNLKFKNYLLDLYYICKQEYKIKDISVSLNYLFYLIKFYENIYALNNFNFSLLKKINNILLYNKFNYFTDKTFLNLDYINIILKTIDKKEQEENWNNILDKTYNSKFLFLYYNSYDYLLNIYNTFSFVDIFVTKDFFNDFMIEKNINYLPKLNQYIINCNYNNNLIYNIYDTNYINTFNSLFNSLISHILKVNGMFDSLNMLKEYIEIYLNHCEFNKNNLQIIKDLYFIIYKNKNNKYLSLINLLLYIKDPIYLYNILTIDLKIYIDKLLLILNKIKNPDFNINIYTRFITFLMHKNSDLNISVSFNPLKFNNKNNLSLITIDELENTKVQDFYSFDSIILLNNAISNLDQYINNGYFNFNLISNIDNINKDNFNILDILNVNKLLKDFNDLFTINNIEGLYFYTFDEFTLYHEMNDFQSLDKCLNYNEFLNFMLLQKSRYQFYNKNNDDNKNNIKIEENIYNSKTFESLYSKNINNIIIKRKSSPASFYKKKRKTKFIKQKVRKLDLTPYDLKDYNEDNEDVDENEYQNDEYSNDFHYQYINVEVTDSDDTVDNNNDINVQEENENELQTTEDDINIQAIKLKIVSEVHNNYKQWESDLEFNEAFIECKKIFNNVLFDFDHPIWEEHKDMFSNNKGIFLNYIKRLNEEEKDSIFYVFWNWTIQEVLKKRELKRNKEIKKRWHSLLKNAADQTDIDERKRSNEILQFFYTNLEQNEQWKKRWHNDLYFLKINKFKGEESNWKTQQLWDTIYNNEPDPRERALGVMEKNTFKKPETQFELWDNSNWWKIR